MSGYPDVEVAVITLLEGVVPAGSVDIETPPDLQERLPFVRVYRFAGGDDGLTDRASMSVDVFTDTRSGGMPLAETIRQLLTRNGGHRVSMPDGTVTVLDRVRTITGPFEPPSSRDRGTDADPDLRRFFAAYNFSARRVWA